MNKDAMAQQVAKVIARHHLRQIFEGAALERRVNDEWSLHVDEAYEILAALPEIGALRAQVVALKEAGVPTLLWCPRCGQQHIDKGLWATVPHRTHYCNYCCTEWRPFEVATYGCSVEDIKRRVTNLETHTPLDRG